MFHLAFTLTVRSLVRGARYATVGGGYGNGVAATAKYAAVSGGFKNTASGYDSFVGGGGARSLDNTGGNVASGGWSAVLGGFGNKASST